MCRRYHCKAYFNRRNWFIHFDSRNKGKSNEIYNLIGNFWLSSLSNSTMESDVAGAIDFHSTHSLSLLSHFYRYVSGPIHSAPIRVFAFEYAAYEIL